MKPEIKQKWVQALRSGKYVKGIERLKKVNGQTQHCCLGVLCELYAQENNNTPWIKEDSKQIFLGKSDWLPAPVQEWAGLYTEDPKTLSAPHGISVINDKKETTFEEIAKIIEAEL